MSEEGQPAFWHAQLARNPVRGWKSLETELNFVETLLFGSAKLLAFVLFKYF